MPCLGKSISLPSISCLDFKLDWDISGASPSVKVTNNSITTNDTHLKWWFYITSPSGNAIYGVDLNSVTPPAPDVNLVAWTSKTFVIPTPFGNPPCGQVEFSPNSPYSVTVFVQDTAGSTIESYTKETVIVRPNGNTSNSCGNFGNANVNVKVDCSGKQIMCFDGTKTIYNNILTPLSTTQKWTLVYPADPAGDVPNMEALNVPNVNFPVSVNSKGYVLYFDQTATYDYGNNITVKVKYKLFDKTGGLGLQFAVNCNTNLCLLQCQMKKFYELSKSKCGELENVQLTKKMVQLQWLFSQILTGIFQPLCGIDVGALIDEMKHLMGTSDGCDCGCGDHDDNFGFSNPTGYGQASGQSGCCPTIVSVLDINTNLAPASCPGSYFPASIYSPDGTTVIGVATNADGMVSIINANAAWNVYGTAFNMGNCTVGFYTKPGIVSVPPVYEGGGTTINVVDGTTGLPPASCPASYFPATVYAPDATTVIGTAGSVSALISIINANAAWNAYGTAYYNGTNCSVAFTPATGVTSVPPITITATTGCVGGVQHYTVTVEDVCAASSPLGMSVSFPLAAWVDFGSGLVPLGVIANNAAFIAALNGASGKPSSVSFSAGPIPAVLNYDVNNTDCTGYSGVVRIYTDSNAGSFLLYGANHGTIATPHAVSSGVDGLGVMNMAYIGKITGIDTDSTFWHTTRVAGNYLVATDHQNGRVWCFDITNPLMPALVGSVNLPDTGSGNCFNGNPQEWGVPMHYGLYFPTDYHNMDLSNIYVCESSTGSIWHVSFAGAPSVVKYYTNNLMKGQCPRVHYKGDIYFTQDGDYRSLFAGVLNLGISIRFAASGSVWNSGSMTQVTIIDNELDEIWAASIDPSTGVIYFTTENGTVVKYDVATSARTGSYVNALGWSATGRLNSKFYLGNLYHSSYGGLFPVGPAPSTATCFIDTATLGTTNVVTFFEPFLSNNASHWNFTPLGNCLGALTYENGTGAAGVAIFKLTGSYLGNIPVPAGALYNVVPISGVGVYAPTTLI